MMGVLGSLYGYRVIVNKYLTYRARRIAKRTWRERLFSLTPFQSRKVVVVDVPSKMLRIMERERMIVCHPMMVDKLKEVTR